MANFHGVVGSVQCPLPGADTETGWGEVDNIRKRFIEHCNYVDPSKTIFRLGNYFTYTNYIAASNVSSNRKLSCYSCESLKDTLEILQK